MELSHFDEYRTLGQLFLELRGRGVALSRQDLEVLLFWQQQGLSAEFIEQVMRHLAVECSQKDRLFPATLEPIARRVNALRKFHQD